MVTRIKIAIEFGQMTTLDIRCIISVMLVPAGFAGHLLRPVHRFSLNLAHAHSCTFP